MHWKILKRQKVEGIKVRHEQPFYALGSGVCRSELYRVSYDHLCLKVFVLVVFIVRVSLVILTKHKEEKEGYKTNNTFPNSNFCVHFILKV
jgi:hypothetical protein